MMRRKIAVITGTRAEFGLLSFLMREIREDADLELQIIATGTHYSKKHGDTHREIEEAGFSITAHFPLPLDTSSAPGICESLAVATTGFSHRFEQLRPDLIVLLGDRYEVLAAAQAALIHRLPIAHLHGGELTEGLIDEAIRHAVTKMSQLHFVAAEPYRNRVLQLGEMPERVFNYGALALDPIRKVPALSREDLEKDLGHPLADSFFLITYHPVTLDPGGAAGAMRRFLSALDRFPNAQVLFTLPNADTESDEIVRAIEAYAQRNPNRARVHASLGQKRYLSLMRLSAAVLGNSSSGLTEAPLLGTPTVNVGDRQKGRLQAESVIQANDEEEAIFQAITRASSPDFRKISAARKSPYDQGGEVASRIKEVLKNIDLHGLVRKPFCDLAVPKP